MTYVSLCVLSELVGKTIKALFLSDDQSRLVVWHAEGVMTYRCSEDDVSETWISDIVGISSLLGHTVLQAEDLHRSEQKDDGRCRRKRDRFFGIELRTTGGRVKILYRCSSNGYCEGSFRRDEEVCYWTDMMDITADYSAQK